MSHIINENKKYNLQILFVDLDNISISYSTKVRYLVTLYCLFTGYLLINCIDLSIQKINSNYYKIN